MLRKKNVSEQDWNVFSSHYNKTTVSPDSIGNTTLTDDSIPTEGMCQDLENFRENYAKFHGYICLVICIFGAIANLLNIVVLTRKEMNGSPINRILTGLLYFQIMIKAKTR